MHEIRVRKYLPFITLVHRASGFVMNLQPCFPSRARLNCRRSRKPIPHLTLGVASLSHAIQCKERRSSELPHQYFAILDLKFLHTFFVRRKQVILKVGIAWAMDLIKVSLPAQANNLSDQPCILSLALSTMWSNVQLVILPTAVGRPRYLSEKASEYI